MASKAQEKARLVAAAGEVALPFRCRGFRAYAADNGDLHMGSDALTPAEALALGRWLIDTFGEPQEEQT